MERYQNKIDGECYNCGHTILTSIVSDDICGDICPRCGEEQVEADTIEYWYKSKLVTWNIIQLKSN